MNTAEKLKISVVDYVEGELISEIKHEYVNGEHLRGTQTTSD